jgi:hypothetical protein
MTNNKKSPLAYQDFERFWAKFDPHHLYSETAKDFVRDLWLVLRQSNLGPQNL